MPQLQNELAEKELIKQFRHDSSWLGELKSKNNWVGNDVIKIPRRGAVPQVLINNSVYPIVSNNRNDDFISLALNKYDTENTDVSEDELYALPYEKVNDVQLQHREELEDKTAEHALFSLAPAANTAKTPILETTGANDGMGRKRLTSADLVRLGKALGDLNVPQSGRVLVLSNAHLYDLLFEDIAREKTWFDVKSGQVNAFHLGFKIYSVTYSPRYTKTGVNFAKNAFGAVPSGVEASICFYNGNAIKATGTVKRFAIPAEMNPTYRKNTMGFQLYFGAFATMDEGFAALVDGTV